MTRIQVTIGVLVLVVVGQAVALVYFATQSGSQPGSTLTVNVTSVGVPLTGVEGRIVIFREGQDQPHANGQLGQPLALAPGVYDLRVVLTSAAGAPMGWQAAVEIAESESAHVSIEVPVGELMTSIDAPASGTVLVQVYEAGNHDRVIAAPNSGERILISPGRYDVRAAYMRDNEEKSVRWNEGVAVQAGLLSAPSATFARSMLLISAQVNGIALESAAVDVTVYRAGDDMRQIVEAGAANVPIELNPGNYDVEVRLLAAADRPLRSIESLEVTEGATTEAQVQFETARITTEGFLAGGQRLGEYAAYVYFYATEDHTQAIAYAPAGQTVVLSAGTYDLRANFFRSADRPDLWLRGVTLTPGEERHVPFNFASGTLIVRVFDAAGEELIGDNAIIRVYTNQGRTVPVATARGGELQVLSVGVYDIAVEDTRSADVQWLEDTEVLAGELTERSARATPGPN